MKMRSLLIPLLAVLLLAVPAKAQDKTPDELKAEKELREFVDSELEKLTSQLKLEYWQEFLVDSIMTHDYQAITEEFNKYKKEKISNTDEYYKVQDKWNDKMYYAIEAILNKDQKALFAKTVMAKAKKQRDKKKAKEAGL